MTIHSIDETHDPLRKSWVTSANDPSGDFPIQNLPLCVFESRGRDAGGGIGIGDTVLDLRAVLGAGLLAGEAAVAAQAAAGSALNDLMALPPTASAALRKAVSDLLRIGGPQEHRVREQAERLLLPMTQARFHLPCRILGYTDFLTSRHHTERHGRFKGLADPLPPAFLSLPVAYHGRTSSLRVSGTDVVRPRGQHKDAEGTVVFGPATALDFELEMGAFVRQGNGLGQPVAIGQARAHLFGMTLFNDWSAKDIQWWEQVLGPFLGKSFMTSLSPWVVTMEALAPFRSAHTARLPSDPPLMPHLHDVEDQANGAFDVRMEAWIRSAAMREQGVAASRLTSTNLRNLYWTFAQMLSHHTSNGCNLEPGDFLGSGTVSGEENGSAACITEITEAGRRPVRIADGEERRWLEDGDEVIFRARAEREGCVSIGFGECSGRVLPAR